MTDPLQSQNLELLKQYDAEFQEIESLPPAVIELTAKQALALITHLQIAAANPAVKMNPLLPSAIAAAKQIQETFNRESAIYELLQFGLSAKRISEQRSIFTTAITRLKGTSRNRTIYYPDEHYHF